MQVIEQASLESVIITDQLRARPLRDRDDKALTAALVKLAQTMANAPDTVLQKLVETGLELCQAQSSGVSILTEIDGKPSFRWDAVAGQYSSFLWGTLPRYFSPCGTVLDTDAVQLMQHPERHFTYLLDVAPHCSEVLLVPFHVEGKIAGTIWIVAHDEKRRFDARDAEVMKTLSEFAAAAFKTGSTMSALRGALDASRANEELARGAMESNTDCVTVLDLEGRVLSMNRNGRRLMELDDLEGIEGRPWLDLWQNPDRQRAFAALETATGGKETPFEGYCKTAKGNGKYWEVTVSPIVDNSGRPSRILAIARDVTARRLEEAQLRETAKLESLGVLAAGIAHDFNNLLTGVLGNASLLEMTVSETDRRFAGEIVKAAERAADLTQQMLAYSGKGRFILQRVSLSRMVDDILRLVRTSIDKKVTVELALDENLPWIEADPAQMQQLIMNLIINASEAMGGGEGKVSISTAAVDVGHAFHARTFRTDRPSLPVGRYVRLEVDDTGCGMSEEVLSKIFDPFFTTKFMGRGLGLAAASGIVRAHNGALQVYSEIGQGTAFKVFFPIAEEFQKKPASEPVCSRKPYHAGTGTILFVDDEPVIRRLGKVYLQSLGYEVLLAENGNVAIDLFKDRHESIRLIILDLTMPAMDGEEAFTLLRKLDGEIPVLVSSGYDGVEVTRRFEKQKIAGFIQKPYTVATLDKAVAEALLPLYEAK